ncbi:glycerate kinase type-2 family protein [Varunaivibrio sulfuroxidans]|nr:glycerate kinase [Varunaivibrio sulfuroxidans]WES32183.1 glycerate kinase [Varunaivibrio sulfuroxidans]
MQSPDAVLKGMFAACLAAADPGRVLPPHLPVPPHGRTLVVGAGKAAASMALALERHWPRRDALGLPDVEGLVVTRYGHGAPCRRIEVVEAAHPVPDAAGEAAARRMLAMVSGLGADDLVICLISGGGSALLTLPAPGVSLEDKRAVNADLLTSGASIDEMNCVRKHLSAIKGGRLAAAAHPARVVTLAISDVPGDDPAVIASGPTVGDPTTFAEARRLLGQYGITPPEAVARHLDAAEDETPAPDDPRLEGGQTILVATPLRALKAAADFARADGYRVAILGDALEGEARTLGQDHAALACAQVAAGGRGRILLSGGETTVRVTGGGRGGRNVEYLLSLAIALDGLDGVSAMACDTDGIDGTEDNAGAIVRPDTLGRARALGLDPRAMLDDNDAYGFFAALGDLVISGPTRTNVNDFRAVLIAP